MSKLRKPKERPVTTTEEQRLEWDAAIRRSIPFLFEDKAEQKKVADWFGQCVASYNLLHDDTFIADLIKSGAEQGMKAMFELAEAMSEHPDKTVGEVFPRRSKQVTLDVRNVPAKPQQVTVRVRKVATKPRKLKAPVHDLAAKARSVRVLTRDAEPRIAARKRYI